MNENSNQNMRVWKAGAFSPARTRSIVIQLEYFYTNENWQSINKLWNNALNNMNIVLGCAFPVIVMRYKQKHEQLLGIWKVKRIRTPLTNNNQLWKWARVQVLFFSPSCFLFSKYLTQTHKDMYTNKMQTNLIMLPLHFFFFFDLRYTIYKELLFDDRSRSLSTAETNNKQQPKMNEGFQNIIHKRKRKKMNISLLDSSI